MERRETIIQHIPMSIRIQGKGVEKNLVITITSKGHMS